MIKKLRTYFKSKSKLDDKCSKLEHQIKLMQGAYGTSKRIHIYVRTEITLS